MPGVSADLRTRRPDIAALECDTLAAKLKRRRLELGLRHVDAAPLLGIGESTLVDWERGQANPAASYFPAIIRFLGYEPWGKPTTLGEQLRTERLRRGLSVKRAALQLLIDEATFARWKRDACAPGAGLREVCGIFLTGR